MAKPFEFDIRYIEDMPDDFRPRRGDLIEFEGRELTVMNVTLGSFVGPPTVTLRDRRGEPLDDE